MRYAFSVVLAAAAAAALAQAPFTIVKPAEGQTVRETVAIVMPKDSVPPGSFIGVTVDGKFLEATVPVADPKTKALVYNLDTKAQGIADGDHTIGITLFTNVGGTAKMADKSEVRVKVGNHTGIRVPAEGLLLRYKFRPGLISTYNVTFGAELSTLTEAQNRRGGRAAQLPLASEHFRLLYAVDDVKSNGVGVVRSQLLPYIGKDYLVITTASEEQPTKHGTDEFAALYQLLTPTGQELYADIPNWWGFPGSGGSGNVISDLYVFLPLPILPTERLQIGDSWQANISMSGESLAEIQNKGVSVEKLPARGTLEAVEWERGKPCARLRYELEIAGRSSRETSALKFANREFKDNDKLRFQEIAWISLDDGRLVRSDFIIEADIKVDVPSSGGGDSGGGRMGGGGGGRMGGGGAGLAPGPSPAGGGGSGMQRGGGGGAGLAPEPGQGPGGGGFTPGRGGNQGGGNQGGQRDSGVFVRQKIYINMVLEKQR